MRINTVVSSFLLYEDRKLSDIVEILVESESVLMLSATIHGDSSGERKQIISFGPTNHVY